MRYCAVESSERQFFTDLRHVFLRTGQFMVTEAGRDESVPLLYCFPDGIQDEVEMARGDRAIQIKRTRL